MKFVDEASLYVKAGDGGRGSASFRREKFVPKGGPDGGDGGKGGDVVISGRKSLISLLDFRYKRIYRAESGKAAEARRRRGGTGKDLYVYVPVGTEVRDGESGAAPCRYRRRRADLCGRQGRTGRTGEHALRQLGEQGTHPSSTRARKGKSGTSTLELKLLARIGIIGLPNAGKSTLLSRLTNASPEVGDYPFHDAHPLSRGDAGGRPQPRPRRHPRHHRGGLEGQGTGAAVSPSHREDGDAPVGDRCIIGGRAPGLHDPRERAVASTERMWRGGRGSSSSTR